jgi:acyl carrier protein
MNPPAVKALLAEVLGVSPAEVPDDASWETYPLWTSLAHLEFMMLLESEYQTKFKTEELLALNSLTAIEVALADRA